MKRCHAKCTGYLWLPPCNSGVTPMDEAYLASRRTTRWVVARGARGAAESLSPSSSSASALDLLSGAVQASVIHLRIYTLDHLYSSITAAPSADRHATIADENIYFLLRGARIYLQYGTCINFHARPRARDIVPSAVMPCGGWHHERTWCQCRVCVGEMARSQRHCAASMKFASTAHFRCFPLIHPRVLHRLLPKGSCLGHPGFHSVPECLRCP